MCTAVARLIPRKRHTKLTAFVARLWNAQCRQLVLSLCVWGTPFSGCRGCGSWAVVHHVHLHRGRGIESGFEMVMFFPFKGSKGSEGSKCLYSFESFGFLKYTREGVRKDRLQQRVRS